MEKTKLVNTSRILAASLIAVLAMGCQNRDNKKAEQREKVRITVAQRMAAEDLANAGEQLISPTTFHLADRVFAMVLEKDPLNEKAKLYRAALKPMMVYKGVLARMRPFVLQHGNKERYQHYVQVELKSSPLKTWLLDGREDLKTVKDMQDVVVQSRQALEEFRRHLKANPNVDLTIYLNEFVQRQILSQQDRNCLVVSEQAGGDFTVECDDRPTTYRKMNSADVAILQQVVGGQVLWITMLTSHSWGGLETALKELKDLEDKLKVCNPEGCDPRYRREFVLPEQLEIFQRIQAQGFGDLRKDQGFGVLRSLGADLKGAIEWAMKYQAQLCPHGTLSNQNRKGYLFEAGVCITSDRAESGAKKLLAYLGQALTGDGTVFVELNDDSGKVVRTVRMRPLVWAQSPPANAVSLLEPTGYNDCGEAAGYKDKTFGGIFVDGDADSFLVSECNESRMSYHANNPPSESETQSEEEKQ